MNVDGFVHAVTEDLGRVAALGDEATAQAALLLTGALDASLRRRLSEALSEAALELSAQIDPDRVDLRVVGSDLELVIVDGAELPRRSDGGEQGLNARLTLRLPESLKLALETAASAAGASVNSYVVQALGRSSEGRSHTHGRTQASGRRLSGYGRS